MATDTADRFSGHLRGLTVTTLASLAGVVAAVVSVVLTADAATPARSSLGLYVLAGAVLVQFPVLQVAGIDVEEFSAKDYLFVAFMTFSLWFVCWAIFLTTGVTF